MLRLLPALAVCLIGAAAAQASAITDFATWSLLEDPPHPGLSANVDNASQVTLTASGAVPNATDIGYASVDGSNVGTSSFGHYFSVDESFRAAVDFSFSQLASVGTAVLGFGIGEDVAGQNGAGVGLIVSNGNPTLIGPNARVNNSQLLVLNTTAGSASGRFFVEYDAGTGDIIVGSSAVQGAASPTFSHTFLAAQVQSQWGGDDLLASVFLRSGAPLFNPLASGTVNAVFSNFEVLSGAALAAPEPASILLLGGLLPLAGVRRRRR